MENIKHLTYFGLVLLAAIQALPAFASETENLKSSNPISQTNPENSSSSKVKPEIESETFSRVQPRIGAFFTTQGAGFDNFGSLEAFFPLFQSPGRNLTFLEGKLLVTTSNGALGGNLLLGHRFISDSGSLLGGYVSFDSRNTGETVFNQLGAGFESLSESLDFRTNVYLPVGSKSVLLGLKTPGTFAFRGNALEIDRVQLFQQALTGIDAEIGTKLASLGNGALRGYAGLYYYTADNINSFIGVRGRLVARPNDNLVVGLTLQSDSVFDTRLIFNIGINLSGVGSGRRSETSVLDRMNESPERQSSITVDNVLIRDTVTAINPATGLAYNFQQVNLGLGSGNGTIESPFGTVQAALNASKPNDIVYVRSGTNLGIPGFTIPDDVKVISSAFPQFIQTQVGKIQLSGSGILPSVTGTVTLGNNTVLSGFAIANSTGAGIEGSNIRNVSIENNTITNSSFQGIRLNNVTGTVKILNNTIDKTGTSYSGIETSNNSGTVDLTITGNQVRNAQSTGDLNPLSDGDGIVSILEGTATGNVNILNNTVGNNGRVGILLGALDSAQVTANISNNTSSNNTDAGILTFLEGSSRGNITIASNTVFGNQNGGISNEFVGNSQASVTISGNNSSNNSGEGIFLGLFDNAQVSATISNNQASGTINPSIFTTTPAGIAVQADSTSQGNVSIVNNTVANNFYGITSSTNESASLKVSITSNNVTGSLQDGVAITTSFPLVNPNPGTSQTNVSLQNNTVTGNNISGAGFSDVSIANFRSGSDICVQLKNNTFGSVTFADKPVAIPPLLNLLNGIVRVEVGFPGSNIATLNPLSASGTIWSGTIASPGSCGFGN